MKLDLAGFTRRVKVLSSRELADLLEEYDRLARRAIAEHAGSVIKGEGDAYWCTFPSVTGAALSAIQLQSALQIEQGFTEDTRMTVRACITAGDVLHRGQDIFGDAVNLAARIEDVTPTNEIYLSHAAWLTLNRSEVKTSLVDHFKFKGFRATERVYRVDQSHRIQVHRNRIVVFTDLADFAGFLETHGLQRVEHLLNMWGAAHKQLAGEHGGRLVATIGDAFFLTFASAEDTLSFCRALAAEVKQLRQLAEEYANVAFRVGATLGDLYQLRAHVFGGSANTAARCCGIKTCRGSSFATLVMTKSVRNRLVGTHWEHAITEMTDLALPSKTKTPGLESGCFLFDAQPCANDVGRR